MSGEGKKNWQLTWSSMYASLVVLELFSDAASGMGTLTKRRTWPARATRAVGRRVLRLQHKQQLLGGSSLQSIFFLPQA